MNSCCEEEREKFFIDFFSVFPIASLCLPKAIQYAQLIIPYEMFNARVACVVSAFTIFYAFNAFQAFISFFSYIF